MIVPGSFDSRPVLNTALALSPDHRIGFSLSVFESLWSGKADYKTSDWLRQTIQMRKLPESWLELTSDALPLTTEQAYKAGAFGVATFFPASQ